MSEEEREKTITLAGNGGIEQFNDNRFQRRFQECVDEALQNMKNPEYPWKKPRTITITMKMKPTSEDGRIVTTDITANTTLPPREPYSHFAMLGTNTDTGEPTITALSEVKEPQQRIPLEPEESDDEKNEAPGLASRFQRSG